MKLTLITFALLLSIACFSQSSINYGAQKDSVGNIYLVRVIQTTTPNGTDVQQSVTKYPTKEEAVKAAWELVSEIKRMEEEAMAIVKSLIESK